MQELTFDEIGQVDGGASYLPQPGLPAMGPPFFRIPVRDLPGGIHHGWHPIRRFDGIYAL